MLTQLATVKARLAISAEDTQYDALLTSAISAVSARFDRECNRTLARTESFTQEFPPDETEIIARCYPIESVAKFELKRSEAEGWVEQPGIEFLIRAGCIISLERSDNLQLSTFFRQPCLARITYTGGYVLPGADPAPPSPPATPLPADLEQAAVEQTAFWFHTRENPGTVRIWPSGGNYVQFADLDLIPSVRAVLERYRRWAV